MKLYIKEEDLLSNWPNDLPKLICKEGETLGDYFLTDEESGIISPTIIPKVTVLNDISKQHNNISNNELARNSGKNFMNILGKFTKNYGVFMGIVEKMYKENVPEKSDCREVFSILRNLKEEVIIPISNKTWKKYLDFKTEDAEKITEYNQEHNTSSSRYSLLYRSYRCIDYVGVGENTTVFIELDGKQHDTNYFQKRVDETSDKIFQESYGILTLRLTTFGPSGCEEARIKEVIKMIRKIFLLIDSFKRGEITKRYNKLNNEILDFMICEKIIKSIIMKIPENVSLKEFTSLTGNFRAYPKLMENCIEIDDVDSLEILGIYRNKLREHFKNYYDFSDISFLL